MQPQETAGSGFFHILSHSVSLFSLGITLPMPNLPWQWSRSFICAGIMGKREAGWRTIPSFQDLVSWEKWCQRSHFLLLLSTVASFLYLLGSNTILCCISYLFERSSVFTHLFSLADIILDRNSRVGLLVPPVKLDPVYQISIWILGQQWMHKTVQFFSFYCFLVECVRRIFVVRFLSWVTNKHKWQLLGVVYSSNHIQWLKVAYNVRDVLLVLEVYITTSGLWYLAMKIEVS